MNPQVEILDGLYHQPSWGQPLSPEIHSPVPAASGCCSPTSIHPPLTYSSSPLPAATGCCSPVGVHSPLTYSSSPLPAATGCCSPAGIHSPLMYSSSPIGAQSPGHSAPMMDVHSLVHTNIQQERFQEALRYNLTNLLKSTAPRVTPTITVAHMYTEHRKIPDGKRPLNFLRWCFIVVCSYQFKHVLNLLKKKANKAHSINKS